MILRNVREAETEGSNIELLSWQEFFSTSLRSPCSYSAEWTDSPRESNLSALLEFSHRF